MPSNAIAPARDAEPSLRRVLALIRDTARVADLDADRLQRVFGVRFDTAGGRLGHGERLTPEWSSSYELDPAGPDGPRFEFAFLPEPPGAYPAMTAICALDFDGVAAELVAMGFRHETVRGEHGRIVHERFDRPGLRVIVETRGESDDTPAAIGHACVRTIRID
jgi:hypothetical protein